MKICFILSILFIITSCASTKTTIIENDLIGNGHIVNGLKQGKWIFYKNDTINSIGYYAKDQLNGIWTYFYPNQKMHQKGNYTNNKQNGIWKYYFDSGQFMGKGLLINDNQEGVWKWYYKNGQLYTERVYKDGRLIEIINCFDKNGNQINCGKITNGNGMLLAHDIFDETDTVEEIIFENGLVKE